MHDGVFRKRGLNKSERELIERLEKPEIFSDDQVEQSLNQSLAQDCQLDPVFLPENLLNDLWVHQKLIEQARAKSLNQFNLGVFRRLECVYWDAAGYPAALEAAQQAEWKEQIDKRRRWLEAKARPGCHPKDLQAAMGRFNCAARKLKVQGPPTKHPGDTVARETRRSSKQLDIDAPIPGARHHAP